MRNTIAAAAVLAVVLVLAAPALADPQPGTAWKKVAAAYAKQSRTHGLKATCTPWNRVMSARCELTRRGRPVGQVLPGYGKGACEFRLTFLSPTFGGNRRATIDLCRPRWWAQLAAVPGPWTKL